MTIITALDENGAAWVLRLLARDYHRAEDDTEKHRRYLLLAEACTLALAERYVQGKKLAGESRAETSNRVTCEWAHKLIKEEAGSI